MFIFVLYYKVIILMFDIVSLGHHDDNYEKQVYWFWKKTKLKINQY